MSTEFYYKLITPERFAETMKKRLKEAYEKLTEDYLRNYSDDYKKHPHPERMDLIGWGEPEKHGESDVCFSGTARFPTVDVDYIRIFFDEIAKTERLMPFDFRLNSALPENHIQMHVRYRGDGWFGFLFFDTSKSGGEGIRCPTCGCVPDIDLCPDWFDTDCPVCGDTLAIEDSVDLFWDSYDIFWTLFQDRLGQFEDHRVYLSGKDKSFHYDVLCKREDKPPIPEKGAHVVLLAPSPIDRAILAPFEFVYEDQISDETDLILIGTDFCCYYDHQDYGKADLSTAACGSPDTADIRNWSIDGKPVFNFVEGGFFVPCGRFNTEKMLPVLDLLEAFYKNGGQTPYVMLNFYSYLF